MSSQVASENAQVSVFTVFLSFLKLGLTSFGGPAAHIGYFRKTFVEEKAWVSESQFGQLLAICQFLPGPASSQLGFAIGVLKAGWLGAIAAFLAFTLPSVAILIGFASALPLLSNTYGEALIHGLKLVACIVVADAVIGMGKKLCSDKQRASIAILAASAVLLIGFAWAQILVVLLAGIAGLFLCRSVNLEAHSQLQVPYGKRLGLSLLTVFFALLAFFILVPAEGLMAIAQAFYQAGALVFGGGHVVLPLIEESVVGTGWVTNENFLAGYGASQAIPGPMFAFAAYLGALIPSEFGYLAGAFSALIFMFLPGFLLLAGVLPLWQSISHKANLAYVIAGINAAVVGILAAALYDPIFTSAISSNLDFVIVILGYGLLTFWKKSPLFIVAWCVFASMMSVI
ncbi:chromate ion family chromate transporter [Marinomonas sp. SBI22]|uniref:chromate efflux transporter n=1 Tax=unclassified Marinomonas TaxID=196814 RepID=UPI0007AF04A9|nr:MULTISPECIES: chromate efflux transporter [unclassified Marinomonas]KZM40821.1 chromate ion family chromate transporter [Marinomonas sp. SBI8L]KZM45994.1 chromate ion family chromate transporter [Marinomonas sp. SBI22]